MDAALFSFFLTWITNGAHVVFERRDIKMIDCFNKDYSATQGTLGDVQQHENDMFTCSL